MKNTGVIKKIKYKAGITTITISLDLKTKGDDKDVGIYLADDGKYYLIGDGDDIQVDPNCPLLLNQKAEFVLMKGKKQSSGKNQGTKLVSVTYGE